MVERRDYIALEWVRGEVDKTLRTARDAWQNQLDSADTAWLTSSGQALQQISDALQLVECHSAALLVSELEQLNQALLDGEASDASAAAVHSLLQAGEQLPVYLDRLAQGQDDSRALILPAVNDLRAHRGAAALTDSALFHPDLDTAAPVRNERHTDTSGIELFRQNNVLQLVRKLRQMYELALLGWLRELDVDANLQYLGKAVSRLALLTEKTPLAALWRTAQAFTTALVAHRLGRTPAVIELLRQLDAELKHLLENPVEVVSLPPDSELLKDLLYQLARADSGDLDAVQAVEPPFQFDTALPEAAASREPAPPPTSSSGLSPAHDAIIQDACAALERVKDALAEFAESRWDTATLATVPAELGSIRADLDEVPLPEADEVLRCIDGYISQQLLHDDEVPEPTDMDALADAIIGVQYYLEQLARDGAADVGLLENAAEAITSLGFPADIQAASAADWNEDLDGSFSALEPDDDLVAALDGLAGFNAADDDSLEAGERTATEADLPLDDLLEADSKAEAGTAEAEDELAYSAEDLDLDGIDSWLAQAESSFASDPDLNDLSGDDSDDDTAADEAALDALGTRAAADTEAESASDSEELDEARPGQPAIDLDLSDLAPVDVDLSALDADEVANLLSEDAEEDDFDIDDALSLDDLGALDEASVAALLNDEDDDELDLELAIKDAFDIDAEEAADDFDIEDLPLSDLDSIGSATPVAAEAEELDLDRAIDADLVATDILDIFVEEVGSVLDSLGEQFPRYRDDAEDAAALAQIRSDFYSLKSSAELVDAEVVADTAGAVEAMLNRLIEGTIARSDDLMRVLEGVIEEIPVLVSAYQQQQAPDARRADDLADKAHLLSRGQPVNWDAAEEEPPVESAAAGDTELDANLDADTELLDIFAQELDEHLDFVEHYLEEAAADQPVPERLHRALHTIKGSARMASVDSVAELVLPLEQRIRELSERRQPLGAELLNLLEEGCRRMRAAADGRAEPDDLDFIDRVLRANASATDDAAAEPGAVSDDNLSDLNSLLMSKGMDTLLEAPATLRQWQQDGQAGSAVAELGHELNRLSEQARDLKLEAVVEQSRGLALLIEMALAGEVTPDDDFFALAERGQESLVNQLDQLAAGQDAAVDADFVEQLRRYRPDADPLHQPPQRLTPLDTMIRHDLIPEDDDHAIEPGEEGRLAGSAEDLFRATGDSELVDLFLEEARDLVDNMQTALEQWEADTTNTLAAESLQRDLHSLKGGAKLAEIAPVAELTHEMESALEGPAQGKPQPSKRLLGLLQQSQDQLATMIQQLTTSRQCQRPTTLLQRLRQLKPTAKPRRTSNSKSTQSQPTQSQLSKNQLSKSPPSNSQPTQNQLTQNQLTQSQVQKTTSMSPASTSPTSVQANSISPTSTILSLTPPILMPSILTRATLTPPILMPPIWTELNSTQLNSTPPNSMPQNLSQPTSTQLNPTPLKTKPSKPEQPNSTVANSTVATSTQPTSSQSTSNQSNLTATATTRTQPNPNPSTLNQSISMRPTSATSTLLTSTSPSLISPSSTLTTSISPASTLPTSISPSSKQTTAMTKTPLAAADARSEAAVSVSSAEVDLDILDIFVEEAAELLVDIEQLLSDWQAEPDSHQHADELKRVLHTLKGGARLAKLNRLGDLCHDFESAVAQLDARKGPADAESLAALLARQDQLVQGVDSMRTLLSRDTTERGEFSPSVSQPRAAEATPASAASRPAPQDSIKVNAELLETLVNLAGESSILRSRLEQEVSDFQFTLGEMDATLERLRDQVRHLDMETEAQVLFRQERALDSGYADFDPLEMDRYSHIQQLSRSLLEASSDLSDLKSTLADKTRDTETLLLQQGRLHSQLQQGLMQTRLVPFSRLVPRLRRLVRQVAAELDKEVELVVANAEGEVDRSVLERMITPLEHMLRNAVDHGIEAASVRQQLGKPTQGRIELSLARDGGDVLLRLSDDGAGLDVERIRARAEQLGWLTPGAPLDDYAVLQTILEPGFSTATAVTQISGRGLGMDVVNAEVKQLGGSLSIDGQPGQGSRFTLRLPFTVSVNRALMVQLGDDCYALPLSGIEGIVRVPVAQLRALLAAERPSYQYAGQAYRPVYLGYLLGIEGQAECPLDSHADDAVVPLILVRRNDESQPVALTVDQLLGSREIVVKSLGPQFNALAGVSGATILGDGSVVVILDLAALLRARLADLNAVAPLLRRAPVQPAKPVSQALTVLVVDDSVTVRKVTSRLLERQGWTVWLAKDGLEAVTLLQNQQPDVILLDIEMPNMDGFEVAQQVRHDDRLKQVPIIMITSRSGDKHRQRAFAIGVNEYLGKPFQEGVLLASIERLCRRESQHVD